ncbi:hypothetical protein M0P65_06160 [Candidatus Gracilibacteria bacterium]|jgi:hypothetical protein|nr:hypothetical protein [Candidatus Gracilibacteria bacterium]
MKKIKYGLSKLFAFIIVFIFGLVIFFGTIICVPFFLLLITSVVKRKSKRIESRINEILKINPDKLYISDVKILAHCNTFTAKMICKMAVRDQKFSEEIDSEGIKFYKLIK